MKVFTSNFRKDAKNPRAIAICRVVPPWWRKPVIQELAPAVSILNLQGADFADAFARQLRALDRAAVIAALRDGDVLLCYEAAFTGCHRHQVADWLKAGGVDVDELQGVWGKSRQYGGGLFGEEESGGL